jgi:hypothetical protein
MKKLIALFAIGLYLRDKGRRDRLLTRARGLFDRAKELTAKRAPETAEPSSPYATSSTY